MSIVRLDEPFNFSRLNNLAAAAARGDVLCFLNNDTEVITAGWLEEMVSLACLDGVGAVGAMLYYPDGKMQHAGVVLGMGGVASHAHKGLAKGSPGDHGRAALTQAMSAVTAACMVVRKALFIDVGGFDETLAVAYNDVDLCLRIGARGLRQRVDALRGAVPLRVCQSRRRFEKRPGRIPGRIQDDSRALGRVAQCRPLFQPESVAKAPGLRAGVSAAPSTSVVGQLTRANQGVEMKTLMRWTGRSWYPLCCPRLPAHRRRPWSGNCRER